MLESPSSEHLRLCHNALPPPEGDSSIAPTKQGRGINDAISIAKEYQSSVLCPQFLKKSPAVGKPQGGEEGKKNGNGWGTVPAEK